MAKKDLTGKRVAILVDEGFEQVELIKPRKALDKIGAKTEIVSPQEGVRLEFEKWGKFVAGQFAGFADLPATTRCSCRAASN
jgi:putative intracellular protease/amidase